MFLNRMAKRKVLSEKNLEEVLLNGRAIRKKKKELASNLIKICNQSTVKEMIWINPQMKIKAVRILAEKTLAFHQTMASITNPKGSLTMIPQNQNSFNRIENTSVILASYLCWRTKNDCFDI
jgi:hypothetical protein